MSENKLQQTFEKLQRQNSDEDFVIYFDKILSSKGKCFNSLGQNLKLDEKNRYNESDKSSFAFISDTKDTKFTGPVRIANVQYLYQYINIKTI